MSITEVLLLLCIQTNLFLLLASVWVLVKKVKELDKRIEEVANAPIHIQYEEYVEDRL